MSKFIAFAILSLLLMRTTSVHAQTNANPKMTPGAADAIAFMKSATAMSIFSVALDEARNVAPRRLSAGAQREFVRILSEVDYTQPINFTTGRADYGIEFHKGHQVGVLFCTDQFSYFFGYQASEENPRPSTALDGFLSVLYDKRRAEMQAWRKKYAGAP